MMPDAETMMSDAETRGVRLFTAMGRGVPEVGEKPVKIGRTPAEYTKKLGHVSNSHRAKLIINLQKTLVVRQKSPFLLHIALAFWKI